MNQLHLSEQNLSEHYKLPLIMQQGPVCRRTSQIQALHMSQENMTQSVLGTKSMKRKVPMQIST